MKTIYAYTTATYRDKGWLKVGQTTQESAAIRVKQQDGTSCPEPLEIKNTWENLPNKISDKKIHKKLREMGCREVRIDANREWFVCTTEQVDIAINDILYGVARPRSYKLREEQKTCVDKATKYFRSGGTEFLMNAKMRFGKTFTSYMIAKKLKARSVLILTYKPATKAGWQEDLDLHTEFDGWHYSTGEGFKLNNSAINVIFASFQDINEFHKKAKWKGITKHKFDLIIIDEMHYGSDTDRAKLTLSKMMGKRTLFVSGTPLDAIISGRFTDDNTYTWSYTDEQSKRRAEKESDWSTNIYRWLPEMEIHTFSVCDEAKRNVAAYSDDEQFTMTKMFGSDTGDNFNDEATVKLFIDQVFGRGVRNNKSPIRTCAADHMLWVMPPNVKSVNAMCNLLEKIVGNEYHIINVAGNNISSLTKVKRHIAHYQKTITVTCGRFNTGVTVPEWDVVFMLGDGKAPETYFQTIFRVQSSDQKRGKEKCYVFDFNPERVLELVYEYGFITAKKGQDIPSSIRQFLEFAPIIDHSGNQLKQINTEDVVSFMSDANRYIDKFTSSYIFNKSLAGQFTELLQLLGGIDNVKNGKLVSTNDLKRGKNFNMTSKKINKRNLKKLEEKILSKAKLVTKLIPEYVAFVDPVNGVAELLNSDRKLFKEHFQISRDYFKDMVQTGFLNEDRMNRLIGGLN